MDKIQQHSPSGSRVTNNIQAAILLLPLILAVAGLQSPPPAIEIFAYGGGAVLLYNIQVLALIPYFVIFILALGDLYLSGFGDGDPQLLRNVDRTLVSFFAGSGILTILGFVLGVLNLLYFWVCFPIFIIIIYHYFLGGKSRQAAVDIWNWIGAKNSSGGFKVGLIFLRAILIAAIASIVLSKGILLELFKDGGLHQYFAYFADTRLYHSTWMDPGHPVLFDYLAGRGQGVYLFFTGFTNQFVIQIIGVIYLIAIGVVCRQVITLLLSILGKRESGISLDLFLPDLGMLLILTSPILQMEPARFHLQTGAFFLFLCWAGPLFLVLDDKKIHWLFISLIPIVVAFPITSGIFYAFICWILGITILALWVARNMLSLKYSFLLLVIGAVSGVVSFFFNWLYVGIPEIQPSSAFIPFIAMDRFQKWSSPGLLFYLDASMKNSVSSSSISIDQTVSNTLSLFSYPWDVLAKRGYYPELLVSVYPILVIGVLLWIARGYLRSRNRMDGTRLTINGSFIYWMTFTSFYILKILLTSFVQQSSLDRMLLFMDIFPVVTFFSMIIFVIHKFEGGPNP